MMKTKFRRLTALAVGLLCCTLMTIPAYAQSDEPQAETTPVETEAPAETAAPNPFTPDGTGTVVDKATDEDGKEFYTITTPDENIFYLVIDNQKSSENVYFLNTVTEQDLLPLAEKSEAGETVQPEPEPTPEPTTDTGEPTEPEPEPEKTNDTMLYLLLIGAVALVGGGAGYYLKIYRPKHQAPDLEDDYCEYEENETEEDEESEDEDTPPWDETDEARKEDEE